VAETEKPAAAPARAAGVRRAARSGNGDSPDQPVPSSYHGGLAAPFCLVASRDFSQAVLTR
jgi:hypothetical protein